MQGPSEGGGVAGLLVEEEDAFAVALLSVGFLARDLGSEPFGGFADAFEGMPAVDMPSDAPLASSFAAAAPLDLFEAADEFGGEGGCG